MRTRSALLGLIFAIVSLPSVAQDHRYGEVVIRQLPDLPQATTHGYHEFPFQVINESVTDTYRVTLSGPDAAHIGYSFQSLGRVERTVLVGPKSRVELALMQPALPAFGNGLRVRIDGRPQSRVIPWSSGHPEYWLSGGGSLNSDRVLISQSLSEDDFPPHPPEEFRVLRSVMSTVSWSDNWLAYSGFDGIALVADDLERAGTGVREALWRYVETGGTLLILGLPDAESSWGRARTTRPHSSFTERGMLVDYTGFGTVLIAERAAGIDQLTPTQFSRVRESWRRSREPWGSTLNPSGFHQQFPVAERVEVPVRGLFLVVLLFTVLIGPVNLAILTRRKKRIWLLWTVPAASLVTCAVVILWVVAGEGLVRFHRIETLTLLDEREHRATTIGWAGYYATLTPAAGLRFDLDTEISPVVSLVSQQGGDSNRVFAWTDTQELRPGWMRARLPSYFVARKSELRRERVSFRRGADGVLEAVNGLGVDLESLVVTDSGGRLHAAPAPVAAGAATRLRPIEGTALPRPEALRGLYRGDLQSRLQRLQKAPVDFLRPSSYLAVARASPFLEKGLEDVDRSILKAVIYGLAAEAVGS